MRPKLISTRSAIKEPPGPNSQDNRARATAQEESTKLTAHAPVDPLVRLLPPTAYSHRCMMWIGTKPCSRWRNAPGTVPMIAKPRDFHSATAPSFVLTTQFELHGEVSGLPRHLERVLAKRTPEPLASRHPQLP